MDKECLRCGTYGGFGCYECIPPEALAELLEAERAEEERRMLEEREMEEHFRKHPHG